LGKNDVGKVVASIGGFFLGAGGWGQGLFQISGANASLIAGLYGASLGSSIWTATHPPDYDEPKMADYAQFDSMMNQVSSVDRIPVIYGTRKWGGYQTYHKVSDDRQHLTKDIILCEGDIDSVTAVKANDLPIVAYPVFAASYNGSAAAANIYISGGTIYLVTYNAYPITYINRWWEGNSRTGRYEHDETVNTTGYLPATTISYPITANSFISFQEWTAVQHDWSFQWYDSSANASQIADGGAKDISTVGVQVPTGGCEWGGDKHPVCHPVTRTKYYYVNVHNYKGKRIHFYASGGLSGCSYEFHNCETPNNWNTVGGYTNCAWIRANFTVSSEIQGNPTITAIVKGKKVWDTRINKYVHSSNPAFCVRDYLLSKRYGAGHFISADMLDESSFQEVADYCDQLVTTRVPTTLATADAVNSKISDLSQYLQCNSDILSDVERTNIQNEIDSLKQSLGTIQTKPVEYTLTVSPRYSINIILTEIKNHIEILKDMFAVFGGFLVFTNNKVAMRCEKQTPVSYAFTDDTMITDSLDHTMYPIEQSPNRYSITFYDPKNQWIGTKIIVDDTVDQQERGKIINKEVGLNGCTNQAQALRLARLYRDKIRLCPIVVQFQTATMAMHLEPGDVITISKKIFPKGVEDWLFKDMPFRIIEISEQKGIYSIKAEQYNESIYNDLLGAKLQVQNFVQIPNPLSGTIPNVSNINTSQTYYKQKDGTIVSDLTVTYDRLNYQFLRNYIVSYSMDGGTSWIPAGSTVDTTFAIRNAIVDKTYCIKIVTENTVGRRSEGSLSQPVIITGKDEPPSNVTNLTIAPVATDTTKVILQWDKVTDVDFNRYSLRYGDGWDKGVSVSDNIFDNQYVFSPTKSGTYNFMVKAVDNSGNDSVIPADCSVNIVLEPGDVTGFTATISEWDRSYIELSWQPNSEQNLSYYEIRYGADDWASATIIAHQLKSTKFKFKLFEEGNKEFLIKAVNTSGYYSNNPAVQQQQILLRPDVPANLNSVQYDRDRSFIILKWDAPSGKDIDGYEISMGGTKIYTKETTYRWQLSNSGTFTYSVRAKTIAGYYSNYAGNSVTVTIEPYDVTGFGANQSVTDRSRVMLFWDKPLELDVAYFEIRKGSTWDSSAVLAQRVTGIFFDTLVKEETEQSFWIKAVSVAGKYSQNPARYDGIYNLNPTPVANIQMRQNPNDKSIVNIMWKGVSDSDLIGYQVKVGYKWDAAEALPLTKEWYYSYSPHETGDLKVMIKSLNAAGFYSDEVSAHLYVTMEPLDVTGFQALQNGEYVEFFWDKHPEPDAVAYEIREGWTFDNGALVASGITMNSHMVKVGSERTYRYHIKAINRSNHYSQKACCQSITVMNLPPKNVIFTYDELALQSGTAVNLEFGQSLINWSNLGGRWSDYSKTKFSEVGGKNVLKLKADTGIALGGAIHYPFAGQYTCRRIDVGQIITANISTQFTSTVLLRQNGYAKLQMRTSTDGTNFTNWQDFYPSLYTFRYVDFQVLLGTDDPTKTPEINQMVISIDVPDIEKLGIVQIPIGGATVSYGTDFYTIPVVTPQAVGENLHAELLSKTKANFTVKIKDKNNIDVGGQLDWRAKGY
jgi:hypothetical protein